MSQLPKNVLELVQMEFGAALLHPSGTQSLT